jgi:fumarate reductase subunit C
VTPARRETLLWVAQRASAGILALCVAVHLITVTYAVRGGLSAAEILGRTRGSAMWLVFYSVFVLAVSVHAPIGLRAIAQEWLGWKGAWRDRVALVIGLALAVAGLRAVAAVFL